MKRASRHSQNKGTGPGLALTRLRSRSRRHALRSKRTPDAPSSPRRSQTPPELGPLVFIADLRDGTAESGSSGNRSIESRQREKLQLLAPVLRRALAAAEERAQDRDQAVKRERLMEELSRALAQVKTLMEHLPLFWPGNRF
jgi:hypothetical protein